jgi:hypothetical protein
MLLEIAIVSFVTQTALLTARVESRFYRWFEPHRGILLLFCAFFALFSIGEFLLDSIYPIAGYSGIRDFGFDLNRLSVVFGARERMFLILIFSAFHRFYELHNHSWKRLFVEEEWFHFTISFVIFYVLVQMLLFLIRVLDFL